MGGDNAPDSVIAGVKLVRQKNANVRFLIFGDELKVRPFLEKYKLDAECYELIHTPDYVASDEKPSSAVRSGRNSSLWLSIEAVKKGKASAVVSSGNTGALMAFSKLILGTMPGIHRPAIVSIMPHQFGKYVMLDLGANTECDALNLAEFALMGDIFARHALGLSRPRVALLNIGAEEMKGKEEIRHAAHLIKTSRLDIDFIGYIEPHEIPNGVADVIVSDGFTGNIALKSIEGTARLVLRLMKNSVQNLGKVIQS